MNLLVIQRVCVWPMCENDFVINGNLCAKPEIMCEEKNRLHRRKVDACKLKCI